MYWHVDTCARRTGWCRWCGHDHQVGCVDHAFQGAHISCRGSRHTKSSDRQFVAKALAMSGHDHQIGLDGPFVSVEGNPGQRQGRLMGLQLQDVTLFAVRHSRSDILTNPPADVTEFSEQCDRTATDLRGATQGRTSSNVEWIVRVGQLGWLVVQIHNASAHDHRSAARNAQQIGNHRRRVHLTSLHNALGASSTTRGRFCAPRILSTTRGRSHIAHGAADPLATAHHASYPTAIT